MPTLAEIAGDPRLLTRQVELRDGTRTLVRPLARGDTGRLADFLAALSPGTRRLSTFDGYGPAAARELCDAIARYDKLRLVLEEPASGRITGLLELGLALTPADTARYAAAGIRLDPSRDCRFGPTLADDHQGRGVGTAVLPLVAEAARLLGRTRMILWGGVPADNPRAVRYYEKNGFRRVAPFTGQDGRSSIDMLLDLRPPRGTAAPGH